MSVDLVRDAAIGVLLRVFERGAHLDEALDKGLRRRQVSERGRRFLTHLVYGTVRHRLLVDHVLAGVLHQPLDDLPAPIRAILRMGVFQSLFSTQVTTPAMVHTSVELAKRRGHAGTARLVNAVLKRAPERIEEVRLPDPESDLERHLSVRYSMPSWLVARWLAEFGEETGQGLCEASNTEAPTTLRANTIRTTPEALAAALAKSGFSAQKRTAVPEEITVSGTVPPVRTKFFQAGHFVLQDAASMLPAHLMEPTAGERILDLCAAPGGKATHLSQLASGEADVVAMDSHCGRLALLAENAFRLGLSNVRGVCGDGTRPPFGAAFDKVLVDPPCTGLGTMRRHPDLKWRVQPEDFEKLAGLQVALLRSGIALCKNGGLIVYSVCTFSPEETEAVAEQALKGNEVAFEDGPEWLSRWRIGPGQYRTLPLEEGLDGFFLMRLRKAS